MAPTIAEEWGWGEECINDFMKKLTRKQLTEECRKVRKRVSSYSPEKKAELLRRGMEIINSGKQKQSGQPLMSKTIAEELCDLIPQLKRGEWFKAEQTAIRIASKCNELRRGAYLAQPQSEERL